MKIAHQRRDEAHSVISHWNSAVAWKPATKHPVLSSLRERQVAEPSHRVREPCPDPLGKISVTVRLHFQQRPEEKTVVRSNQRQQPAGQYDRAAAVCPPAEAVMPDLIV
jgi:hypothetical protein